MLCVVCWIILLNSEANGDLGQVLNHKLKSLFVTDIQQSTNSLICKSSKIAPRVQKIPASRYAMSCPTACMYWDTEFIVTFIIRRREMMNQKPFPMSCFIASFEGSTIKACPPEMQFLSLFIGNSTKFGDWEQILLSTLYITPPWW